MNADERIINSNFRLLEKAVASTLRNEEKSEATSLIKKAVRELRYYLPNVELSIREYFAFGCTNLGKTYFYNGLFRNSKQYSKIKEVVATEDWSRF